MLKLTLVTPNKKILTDAEVEEVFVPAFRGEINILPAHAALVTSLNSGLLKWRLKGSSELHAASIAWGYCEVFNDNVSVLADFAELPEEIDVAQAQESLREAEAALAKADASPEELDNLTKRLKKAQSRLRLLEEFPVGSTRAQAGQASGH
jgi:F-type H+-transporting ATPase subunit epsilon